jgi:putative peptidoglycan lipid II flippase
VLSASFIPVYARLLGEGRREDADRVAGAVFGLLSLLVAVLVALGIFAAPWIVGVVVGGFAETGPAAFAKAVQLTRILFPSTGLLVLSAWCLGVLNSHRKFFLSYAAPVVWNLAQIAVLLVAGPRVDEDRLTTLLAWGVVAGSALQLVVQLPVLWPLLGRFRPSLDTTSAAMRAVLRGFAPILVARGVVQVSALVDTYYASLISPQTVAVLGYTQRWRAPGVALPGCRSRRRAARARPERRWGPGRRQLGRASTGPRAHRLLRGSLRGAFRRRRRARAPVPDRPVRRRRHHWLWYSRSAVGLVAARWEAVRVGVHAQDARTPLLFASLRVVLSAVLAYVSVRYGPDGSGAGEIGAVGVPRPPSSPPGSLPAAPGARSPHGRTGIPGRRLAVLGKRARGRRSPARKDGSPPGRPGTLDRALGVAGVPAPALHPVLVAALLVPVFGGVYLGLTALGGASQLRTVLSRLRA